MEWDCEAGRRDTGVGDAGSGGTREKQSSPFKEITFGMLFVQCKFH